VKLTERQIRRIIHEEIVKAENKRFSKRSTKMRVTKKRLSRIIKEESSRLSEQRKFRRMLLKEASEGGDMMKMAFKAIEKSADAAKWVAQFLKAHPEIGEAVMGMLAPGEEAE